MSKPSLEYDILKIFSLTFLLESRVPHPPEKNIIKENSGTSSRSLLDEEPYQRKLYKINGSPCHQKFVLIPINLDNFTLVGHLSLLIYHLYHYPNAN